MKKELGHFCIDGSYGGNQDWFRTYMMRLGGCGAETACDSSLYFAMHRDVKDIYPFDADKLSREDYVEFAHMMEKYLKPRMSGINKTDIYIDGYTKYLKDRDVSCIAMESLEGSEPYEKAAEAVRYQIDHGYPVPTLILNHRDKGLKDYVWHWFLINGYEEREDSLMVKTVTYSSWRWLDLRSLWDTGYAGKGGLVLYREKEKKEMKTLIAYFSASGYTGSLAKRVAEAAGGDLFEIRPAIPYSEADLRWTNPLARCNREKIGKKDVPLADKVHNFDEYELVLIGFPIWYFTAPNIIGTFVKSHDFTGKKVGLFATSGGSDISKAPGTLQPLMKGEIVGAKLFSADADRASISAWLAALK